jgi:hypothetical protein
LKHYDRPFSTRQQDHTSLKVLFNVYNILASSNFKGNQVFKLLEDTLPQHVAIEVAFQFIT